MGCFGFQLSPYRNAKEAVSHRGTASFMPCFRRFLPDAMSLRVSLAS